MEFIECVKSRRSIRKFSDKKVSAETFKQIVEVSRFSPSWKNSQIVRYNFISNEQLKNKIADECVLNFTFNQNTIKNAPAIVVISAVAKRCGYERDGSFTTSKGDRWEMFDCGIATQTFCLTAYEKGLSSVIMGIFDEEKTAQTINLDTNQKVMAIVALGYSDVQADTPARKDVEQLVTINE